MYTTGPIEYGGAFSVAESCARRWLSGTSEVVRARAENDKGTIKMESRSGETKRLFD